MEGQKGVSLEIIPSEIITNYADRDIVIIDDIRKIPEELLFGDPFTPNFYIFVFCLNGKLQVDCKTETIELSANDILCNHSNVMLQNCMVNPDFEARIMFLSPQIVSHLLHSGKSIWYNYFYTNQNPVVNIGEEGRILFMAYFELLEHKLKQEKHPYYKESISGLISAALYDLHAYLMEHSSVSGDNSTLTQGDLLFKRFIDLLSREEVKDRRVSYYADKLCISSKYLSTTIKEVSGKTPHAWIDEYVMADIQYHLKHSEKSVKEVAEYLGFDNLSFFGKYVKKHLGMSPKDYRKELENDRV